MTEATERNVTADRSTSSTGPFGGCNSAMRNASRQAGRQPGSWLASSGEFGMRTAGFRVAGLRMPEMPDFGCRTPDAREESKSFDVPSRVWNPASGNGIRCTQTRVTGPEAARDSRHDLGSINPGCEDPRTGLGVSPRASQPESSGVDRDHVAQGSIDSDHPEKRGPSQNGPIGLVPTKSGRKTRARAALKDPARSEPRREVGEAHWFGNEVALSDVTLSSAQQIPRPPVLHPFGDDPHSGVSAPGPRSMSRSLPDARRRPCP